MTQDISQFIREQLAVWPLARDNFSAVGSTLVRELNVGGLTARVQFNPCRIVSSTAEIDPATLAARPCFLCTQHRPPEQYHLDYHAPGGHYHIQVNPFPIFPEHLVIARHEHIPQSIREYVDDMLDLACRYPSRTLYYNGPASGASAPDHLHFQSCPRGLLPLEAAADEMMDAPGNALATQEGASIYHLQRFTRGVYCISAALDDTADACTSVAGLFRRFLDIVAETVPVPGESEPRLNLYAWTSGTQLRLMAVLRTEIRSHHYYAHGPEHLTISPGAAEMAGVFVAPMQEDFDKVTAEQLTQMLAEVSITESAERRINAAVMGASRPQPTIEVGIVTAPRIRFEFIGDGRGVREASIEDGRVVLEPADTDLSAPHGEFMIYGVTIGIDFHWQQQRDLRYSGRLRFVVDGDNLVAVNSLGLEDYLLSVISSEMKSSASLELLKAHAVISRSWCIRRMQDRRAGAPNIPHTLFDVCADDHCQRYQGIGMATGDKVRQAIDQTWGQVLRYDGELCDARYSKCCGGITELFSSCWEDEDPGYLRSFADVPEGGGRCFCDCEDSSVLSQVLNDYDLTTRDFYRWRVRYTQDEISELVHRRTGADLGTVQALEPLRRGPSGRIISLRISGTRGSVELAKELAVRRALSTSHLKSSAFEVSRDGDDFVLEGRGWGHGVGLCQIGAAVMADQGYDYIQILKHYYRGADIQ